MKVNFSNGLYCNEGLVYFVSMVCWEEIYGGILIDVIFVDRD